MNIQIVNIFYSREDITVRFFINDPSLDPQYFDFKMQYPIPVDVDTNNSKEVGLLAIKRLSDLFMKVRNSLQQVHNSKDVKLPWTSP